MSKLTGFESTLIVLNSIGFLGYMFWLVFKAGSFMYTQEGVLYLLPCLPFFFVYFSIFQKKKAEETKEEDNDETANGR